MSYSPAQIAEILNASLIWPGSGDIRIRALSYFEDARKDELTFTDKRRTLRALPSSKAGAAIVPSGTFEQFESRLQHGAPALLESKRPRADFFKLVPFFHPEPPLPPPRIDPGAVIGDNCRIDPGVSVHPNVTIGDDVVLNPGCILMPGACLGNRVRIGKNTVIEPNVTVMDDTAIGDDCLIRSGTVIGCVDFRFSTSARSLLSFGSVELGSRVVIGANSVIARGIIGRTRIEDGVRTGNLVQISHNVIVREDAFILAQACIAGRTIIGRNAIIGAQSAISDHLVVGDNAIVGPTAAVPKNVAPGEAVSSGAVAMPYDLSLKVAAAMPSLPEMRKAYLRLKKGTGATVRDGVKNKA